MLNDADTEILLQADHRRRLYPIELMARLIRKIHARSMVLRERANLRRLTDRQLKDIGLTREGAVREAARPFWR